MAYLVRRRRCQRMVATALALRNSAKASSFHGFPRRESGFFGFWFGPA
jgi:hypothetical protein